MMLHPHVKWLWREVWSRRRVFLAALFCTGASAGLYVLMPLWASQLVGDVFTSGGVTGLARHLLLGLAIFMAASLLTFGRIYLMTSLSLSITAAIRGRLFHQILQANPRMLTSVGGGQLISSFSNDLQIFQEALIRVVAVFAPSVILFLIFGGAMAYYSWLLFLSSVILISPLALVTSYFGSRLHGAAHATQDRLAGLVGRFDEMLGGSKEIKSFNREEDVGRRFETLNAATLETQLRRERIDAFHPVAVSLAAALGIAAMVFLSALLLERELISLETLTAFLVCVGLAYSPLQEASHSVGRMIQLSAILDRFQRIIDIPSEKGGDRRLPAGTAKGAIRFENVSFAYQPDEPDGFRIDDLSFDIAPGQRVALVGPSGGGKSTIIDLVPRFLTPDSGRVLIDGRDAASLNLADLRREIGVVFQQPVLFEGTLLENLRFGAPDATMEQVIEAAKAAYVDEFARHLPGGYEAKLEPKGANLSVGQRQRIAIARVFLKDPRILLLDEPTSALDADSERFVRDALERASEGRTTLIVAHRLSTVRAADRILVIRRGRIVEDGTHDQLYEAGGIYHRLCEEQLSGETPA